MAKSINIVRRIWGGLGAWRPVAESVLVSSVVSAIISGGVLVLGTARIETSKEYISSISRQQSQLDAAQIGLFAQLSLYTGKVFEKGDVGNKDQLQTAIVTTQLQINRLLNELPKPQHASLLQYSNELENLSKGLREIKSKQDLGVILSSAQKLLAIHDEINERMRENMDVNVFSPRKS